MSSWSAGARVRRAPAIAAGVALALAAAEPSAAAPGPCVGADRGCFAGIQAAVDAAKDGDTIRIRPGVYPGGVTITKSVSIVGSGARATVIRGGGPVVTIGAFGAATQPTVSIAGVSITDGATAGSPFPGLERAIAAGGGVFVPPGADGNGGGATVTIVDSVIADNRAAPAQSVRPDDGGPQCPGIGRCPFAIAQGGGIASSGPLTLRDTVVAGNRVGSASGLPDASSDAEGGGIAAFGPLTLIDTTVTDNRAASTPPNGRFAEGAGIWTANAQTTMRGGELSRNVADLSSAFPREVEQLAVGAAMQVTDAGATTTFEGVRIADNRLRATNSVGDATAFAAGPHVFGTLVVRDTAITGNRIAATVPAGAPGDAIATSGGIEIDDNGTVTGSRFEDNSIQARGPNGAVSQGAGIALAPLDGEAATVSDSVVRGNTLVADGGASATAQGAGIQTVGMFTLDGVSVARNTVAATGPSGLAQGGGIWNSRAFYDDAPPAPVLTLRDTTVRRNAVQASPGIHAQGGGLFTESPVTQVDARIADNVPDDCFGC